MKVQAKVNVPAGGVVSFTVGGKVVELELGPPSSIGTTPVTIHCATPIKALRMMQQLPLGEATPAKPIDTGPKLSSFDERPGRSKTA